mgnify:CR=1 FL=1
MAAGGRLTLTLTLTLALVLALALALALTTETPWLQAGGRAFKDGLAPDMAWARPRVEIVSR